MLRESALLSVIFVVVILCTVVHDNRKNPAAEEDKTAENAYVSTLRDVTGVDANTEDSFSQKMRQAEIKHKEGTEDKKERVKRGRRRRRRYRRKEATAKRKASERYEAQLRIQLDALKTSHKKLHAAWYMQHFKLFGYFNGLVLKRVQRSKKTWWQDWMYAFPTQPTIRLDVELEEVCEKSVEKCMRHVQNTSVHSAVYRTQGVHLLANTTNIRLPRPDLFAEYKVLEPFGRLKEEYIYKATAMYYLCWWTMQEAEYLKHLTDRSDTLHGKCQAWGLWDYRADDSIPWACALYSFCPDPCCHPGKSAAERVKRPEPRVGPTNDGASMWPKDAADCRSRAGNPCWTIGDGTCALDRKNNQNLQDLMRNRINVTCNCGSMIHGFKWYQPAKGCIDVNECLEAQRAGNKSICPKHTVCRNTQGSYNCLCRKHYTATAASAVLSVKLQDERIRENVAKMKKRPWWEGKRKRDIEDGSILMAVNQSAVTDNKGVRIRKTIDGEEILDRVKRGRRRRRRKKKKKPKPPPPPPPRPKVKPRLQDSPSYEKCHRNKSDDIFLTILEILQESESQSVWDMRKKKPGSLEAKAKKMEAAMRSLWRFLRGEKSAAVSVYGTGFILSCHLWIFALAIPLLLYGSVCIL